METILIETKLAGAPPSSQSNSAGDTMTGLRIFQIGTGWFPETKGGTENVYYSLANSFAAGGAAVTGLVSGRGRAETDTDGRIRSFSVDQPLLRRASAIRSALKASFATEKPNLIASHFALYTLPVLDRLRGMPLVTHFHGPWALESVAEGAARPAVLAKMAVEQSVYRRSDRIIAMSDAFREVLIRRYRLPERKIDMVPNGVDTAAFDLPVSPDVARQQLGWEPGRPTVFTVRRLVRRMGLDRLITAWAEMRGQGHGLDAMLHIAGKGPERAALERQVTELELSACIKFDGLISDEALRLSYRAADLTIIPTASLEGFGLIAAESLAAGTPVLTTPVGGLPEVVSGLSAAMVLSGTTARDIATGLSDTLADPARMPSSAACRDYAQQTYDWSVITPKVAAVYRSAL